MGRTSMNSTNMEAISEEDSEEELKNNTDQSELIDLERTI